MLTGFIDTATSEATSVLPGVLGTRAAKIRTIAPTHEISGLMGPFICMGSQWNTMPIAPAVTTRYTRPRSRMRLGSLSLRRV